MQNKIQYEYLKDFTITGCYVRSKKILAFTAQKTEIDDPLDIKPTRVLFFYPDKSGADRWAFREPAQTRDFRGCAVTTPEERWVFVADDGMVYVVGGGVDAFEKPITPKSSFFFSNVKTVSGKAHAVGPLRKVFVRDAPDNWRQLEAGLFPEGDKTKHDSSGFSDIDGFSESDMYACGGRGDLWHFDGSLWTQVKIPTTDNLWRLCCGKNGLVYIITGGRQILVGRNQSWQLVDQDLTDQTFESIVVFNDKVIISTESALFEMVGDKLRPASLGDIPTMKSYSFLAAGDGVLVVSGGEEAAMFDGTKWTRIE